MIIAGPGTLQVKSPLVLRQIHGLLALMGLSLTYVLRTTNATAS